MCKSKAYPFRPTQTEHPFPSTIDLMPVNGTSERNGNHPVLNHVRTRATFFNRALGHGDVSLCVEPQHVPSQFMHTGRHPAGRILICQRCKDVRLREWQWRKRQIAIGVCNTCRNWALAHLDPGQNDCECEPAGNYINAVNNNERRQHHMCQMHMTYYWNNIVRIATQELHDRQHLIRTYPKRSGHGWTRRKRQWSVRTPKQRRVATRILPQQFGPLNVPTCYCGNAIGVQGHSILAPPFPAAEIPEAQVRNCLGCGKFVRYW